MVSCLIRDKFFVSQPLPRERDILHRPVPAGRPLRPAIGHTLYTVIYMRLTRLFPSLVAVRSLHRALLQTPNERSLRFSIQKRQRSYRYIVIKLQFQLPNLTLITIIIRL